MRETGSVMRRRFAGWAAAVLAIALLPGLDEARAQVVAVVNGQPITAFDIAQRSRLIQLSTRKTPSRQEALDELIDDKLKLTIAQRYTINIPEREVESSFSTIARRSGLSAKQFEQVLSQSGITPSSFKSKLRSDIAWSYIVRGKFQSTFQVGDKDVSLALQGQGAEAAADVSHEYRLYPILFVVPRGSAAAAYEAKRKDAEAFRARFQSCDEGLAAARAMRDVAVRSRILRNSAELGEQQRKVLDATPVGKLTPPETTAQGVEMFAMCGKELSKGDDTPAKRAMRDKIIGERLETASKRYLKELRRNAMIEMR